MTIERRCARTRFLTPPPGGAVSPRVFFLGTFWALELVPEAARASPLPHCSGRKRFSPLGPHSRRWLPLRNHVPPERESVRDQNAKFLRGIYRRGTRGSVSPRGRLVAPGGGGGEVSKSSYPGNEARFPFSFSYFGWKYEFYPHIRRSFASKTSSF